MKIKQIEVVYSLTCNNLGNYSNVRSSVKLTAELDEGEDEGEVRQALMLTARGQVEAEIDRALEQQERPPEFYKGPRYSLLYNTCEKLAVLVQMRDKEKLPDYWRWQTERWRNHRREFVLARYVESMADFQLLEAMEGAMDQLPELAKLTTFTHGEEKLLVLVNDGIYAQNIVRERGSGWWDIGFGETGWRRPEAKLAEAQAEAEEKGFKFIDMRDGDLEKLPYLEGAEEQGNEGGGEQDEFEYDPLEDIDGDEAEWDN